MEYDLLFSDVTAVPMEDEAKVLEHAYIAVADGKIAYVGTAAPKGTAKRTVSGSRLVVIPGLINAHTHVSMTLLRGFADDLPLQSWLFDHIFPAEATIGADAVRCAAKLGIMEMFAGGITGIADSYFHQATLAGLCSRMGMHACLTNEPVWFGDGTVPPTDRSVWEIEDLRRNFARDPFVTATSGIHAPNTTNPDTWIWARDYAKAYGLSLQLHLAETAAEDAQIREKYGMSPVAVMEKYGVLDVPVTAAHCVHVDTADRAILAAHGTSAVHCPSSNLKLASGIAPVQAMLDAGIPVALGTDGVASNNSHDLIREMRLAAFLAKVSEKDAAALNAYTALRMATVHGAIATGRAHRAGRIREGFDADLAVLDFDRPHLTPCYDVVSNLVYSATAQDVVLTLSAGRVVYDHGTWPGIDANKAMADVRACTQQLCR